jgi:hypothetical protein
VSRSLPTKKHSISVVQNPLQISFMSVHQQAPTAKQKKAKAFTRQTFFAHQLLSEQYWSTTL